MNFESKKTRNPDLSVSACGNDPSDINDVYVFGETFHHDENDEVYEFECKSVEVPQSAGLDQKITSDTAIPNRFIDRAGNALGNRPRSATQDRTESRQASASLRPWTLGVGIPSVALGCFLCFTLFLNSRQSTNHKSPPIQDLAYQPSQQSTTPPLDKQSVISAVVDEQEDVIEFYRTGNEHYEAKRYHEAIQSYEAALTLDPNNGIACNNLALVLATCPNALYRDGTRARTLSERACHLTNYSDWQFLSIRAAAEAECGDFINAIKYAKLAAAKAPSERRIDVERMLEELHNQKPYRWP